MNRIVMAIDDVRTYPLPRPAFLAFAADHPAFSLQVDHTSPALGRPASASTTSVAASTCTVVPSTATAFPLKLRPSSNDEITFLIFN